MGPPDKFPKLSRSRGPDIQARSLVVLCPIAEPWAWLLSGLGPAGSISPRSLDKPPPVTSACFRVWRPGEGGRRPLLLRPHPYPMPVGLLLSPPRRLWAAAGSRPRRKAPCQPPISGHPLLPAPGTQVGRRLALGGSLKGGSGPFPATSARPRTQDLTFPLRFRPGDAHVG